MYAYQMRKVFVRLHLSSVSPPGVRNPKKQFHDQIILSMLTYMRFTRMGDKKYSFENLKKILFFTKTKNNINIIFISLARDTDYSIEM